MSEFLDWLLKVDNDKGNPEITSESTNSEQSTNKLKLQKCKENDST